MADELLQLIALGGDPPAADDDATDDEHNEHPLELQDLHAIVALAADRPLHRHPARSWQLMERARGAKAVKRELLAKEDEISKRQAVEAVVGAIGSQFPIVAKTAGIKIEQAPFGALRARLCTRLACMPALRGRGSGPQAQQRAACVVALAVEQVQSDHIKQTFLLII